MLGLTLALLIAAAPAPKVVLDPVQVQALQDFVVAVRPDVNPRQARRLAAIAADVGTRQGVDPWLLLAIARLESNFESGILACWLNPRYGGFTCDHGLMQINDVWVRTWDLDALRLRADDYLNMWTAARLLVKLKAEFGAEPNWYSRYHNNQAEKRQAWEQKLHSFLEKAL